MVYVPVGAFYAGDNATSTASLKQGSTDNDPWYIQNSDAISVTNATENGFYYVSNGNTGEDATGSVFTIPADFPNGYDAFYCMKYEISQGQYVDFLNTLTSTQDATRYMTETIYRHGTWGGSAGSRTTTTPDRACNFLSWADGAAYSDWAGLRPMTELEFEKACRGTGSAVANEYAWGTDSPVAITSETDDGAGTSTKNPANANVCYNNGLQGPVRCGIFAASGAVSRTNAGATYYGIMEMSGNLWERSVTLGNSAGRGFTGTNGNGVLASNGNADVSNWPGTTASGAGCRGGGWNYGAAYLHVSDRSFAVDTDAVRRGNYGFRSARTQ